MFSYDVFPAVFPNLQVSMKFCKMISFAEKLLSYRSVSEVGQCFFKFKLINLFLITWSICD